MPEDICSGSRFPGPGLAVRIVGEVTADRVALIQDADEIVVSEIKKAGSTSRSGSRSRCCCR